MTSRTVLWWVVLAACVAPAWCSAQPQVDVSLPLQGYYRPGRYVPVRIVTRLAADPASPLTIRAGGAVTTVVNLSARAEDVVPWLPLQALRDARWSIPGVAEGTFRETLTELTDNDVLVGYAGSASAAEASRAGGEAWAGKNVIAVPLDATEPVRPPVMAWGVMDALVTDVRPEIFHLDKHVAAGTSVFVRAAGASADKPPDDIWPWRRSGAWWVLRAQVAGPRGVIIPEAYEPAYAWRPGRTPELRRGLLLAAVAVSIVAVALTLWRSRRAWLAVVLWCAVACGCVVGWSARQPTLYKAVGRVYVRGGPMLQADRWGFARSLAQRPAVIDWEGGTAVPVFASSAHLSHTDMTLYCGAHGAASHFSWPAGRNTTVAFLGRTLYSDFSSPAPVPAPARPPSPMRDLARGVYLRPGTGDQVIDVDDGPPPQEDFEWWPPVLVEQEQPRRD